MLTSGTFVMFTKDAPKLRYIWLSALLENLGPSTANHNRQLIKPFNLQFSYNFCHINLLTTTVPLG